MSRGNGRTALWVGIALTIGVGAGAGLAARWLAPATPRVAAGTEVVSMLEEEVMSVVYVVRDTRVTAQRSRPNDPFAVQVTYADGRKPVHCSATPALGGRLAPLTTFVARRQLAPDRVEAAYPRLLGYLSLENRMQGDRGPRLELRMNDQRAVAAVFDGAAVELELQPDVLERLLGSCDAAPAAQ